MVVRKDIDVPPTARCLLFLFALLGTPSYAGDLVVIGGELNILNEAVYGAIIERLDNSSVCVFGTASGDPEEAAQSYAGAFARYGAEAIFVDISEDNAAQSTSDGAILDQIAACGGYFFTGGDQRRITEAFLVEGEDTPALTTLRARFDAGAVIAGSSAGAAALSRVMIGGGSSVDTLLLGENAVTLEPGLSFARGVIFDQHFVERGRFGRLLGALVETGVPLGAGIGENTALVIPESGPWQVLGEKHVVLIEMPPDASLAPLEGVLVSLLAGGDSFDPETETFSVRLERINTQEVGYYFEAGDIFAIDAFGPGVLTDLLTQLVDSPESGASGLGFVGNSAASFSADGVRVTLRKTPQTMGYWGRISDADNYSVVRVGLSIEPVTVRVGPKGDTEDGGVAEGERSP